MVKTNRTQLNELQQKIPEINDKAMVGVFRTKDLEDQAKKLKDESDLANTDALIAHITELKVCFQNALRMINHFPDVLDPLYDQVEELDENDENDENDSGSNSE